ncbi:unnamed protein product [Closterium sp. NIES-53]
MADTPAVPCTAFFYTLSVSAGVSDMVASHILIASIRGFSAACKLALAHPEQRITSVTIPRLPTTTGQHHMPHPLSSHPLSAPAHPLPLQSDTCISISESVGITKDDLMALNPGLDCTQTIKSGRSLCVERNETYAYTTPECVKYATLTERDTCEHLLKGSGNQIEPSSWAELYRNNPGLVCSNTVPGSASAVGSNIGVQVRGETESGNKERGGMCGCEVERWKAAEQGGDIKIATQVSH